MSNEIDIYNCNSNMLLNSKQASEYLGFKLSYLYNLVHKGEIKVYKCGNKAKGSLRFLKSDLNKYLGRPDNDN